MGERDRDKESGSHSDRQRQRQTDREIERLKVKAIKVNNTIELCYIVIIHVSYIHVKQLHESFIAIVLHTNKKIPVYNIKHVGLYRP